MDDKKRRQILIVASLGSACSGFDLSLMFVTYPAIRSAYPSVSLTRMSFVLTVYTIVAAAVLIPSGRFADRVGRSRAFLLGIGCFLVGTSAAAVAPSVNLLITARLVQAVGGALITPSSIGLVMSVYPPERRSTALGVWSSVTSALASTAPVLGSLAIRAGSWRYAFLLTIPLCLVCLVLGRRVLEPEPIDRTQKFPDLLGSAMIALALASLAYAIVQTNTWGWLDGRTLAVAAIPITLIPLFIWRCRCHPTPVVDFAAVRAASGFGGVAAYAIAIGILYWGTFYVTVQLLAKGWNYSIVETGVRMVPLSIPAVFLGRLSGRLIDRHGFRYTMLPSGVLFGLAMLSVAALSGHNANMLLWVPTGIFVGACTNMLFIGANTAGAASAPVEALSVMTAIVQTMMRIGGVIGSALAVTIIGDASADRGPSQFRTTFLMLAVMAALSAGAVLLLRERPGTTASRRVLAIEPG